MVVLPIAFPVILSVVLPGVWAVAPPVVRTFACSVILRAIRAAEVRVAVRVALLVALEAALSIAR